VSLNTLQSIQNAHTIQHTTVRTDLVLLHARTHTFIPVLKLEIEEIRE